MIDNDYVSIITPTWNCERFISETIESVLAQTYPNWEMIIVDDCSTDDTRLIVERFAKNDKRIKYICLERNSGAAVARDTALKLARGRWIAFLDSDDLWSPKKLELQINFMVENGFSFSYHNYSEIDENGLSLNTIVSGPRHITRIGMISYCWPGCLTVMYDKTIIGDIQIPDIKKNNDYAMWLFVSRKASCFLMNKSLAMYRRRIGSISNHSYISLIKWHYRLFREIESSHPVLAVLQTLNNLFWGLYKKFIYLKATHN